MDTQIEYLPDSAIDDATDRELRRLLTACFTKPQDVVFRDRRYFAEPYPHRWVIRDAGGALVAHLGVHEKTIHAAGKSFRIGGIAEVCSHPEYRGKGYVRRMLDAAHPWLLENGFDFAALFGDPRVYSSSGYTNADNVLCEGADRSWRPVTLMYKPISGAPWPSGPVRLPGPEF